MSRPIDIGALQDVLDDWRGAPISEPNGDGVLHRILQILGASQKIGALTSAADLAPLVRQVLRRQSLKSGQAARLRVPMGGGWPTAQQWAQHGVTAHSEAAGYAVVEANPWRPAWLPDDDTPTFEAAFGQQIVRMDWTCPIDPFLEAATGFETYVSPGQREAVRSAFLLPPGETLIVSLPTGAGKSFVAQAPVLVRGLEGPLTLCVVPTTALALDQARRMAAALALRSGGEKPLLAWHAGLSADERQAIKSAIREGRQGILFCSPEAVNAALLPALYDAARAGLLGYLVIDEAHLVTQWGDGFRPAFQLLAGVRRGLLDACQGPGFRTLLMSATLTPETIETIVALFGPAHSVRIVASVHLRPEPQYWIHCEDEAASKDRKILEALRHAPRPFLLYTTTREDAGRWLALLKKEGCQRLALFHGDTADAERRRIIEAWAEDRLDGVVATSAFGVGIDKGDVRTVIHAAVPETLDRFYQEVGRGGRDGRPSAALLVYSARDLEVAKNLASPTLIGGDLAFERWSTLFSTADKLDEVGENLRINLDEVPPRLRQQSEYNDSWNMRTLIMMARAGILQLESSPPAVLARLADEAEEEFTLRNEAYWQRYFTQVTVRVKDFHHQDPERFEAAIEGERQRSFQAALTNIDLLERLLSGQAEVSDLLDRLYRNHAPGRTVIVSRACGGCPADRRAQTQRRSYERPPAYGIEDVGPVDLSLWRERFADLDPNAPIVLTLDDAAIPGVTLTVLEDLVSLFGVREIATSAAFRGGNPGLKKVHERAANGLVLLQDLHEEAMRPQSYRLARATVLVDLSIPPPAHLFMLERPLHVLIATASTRDPWQPDRRLGDTGVNLLSFERFKLGARI